MGLEPTSCQEPQRLGIACLPGWRRSELNWSTVPPLRGEYPREKPAVECGFPFGLWRSRIEVGVSKQLIVWPKTFSVGPIPEAAGDRQLEGSAPRNRAGVSGDFLGVRPYRRGDSLRRIHWGHTAKHDRPIVCELQSTALPWIQLVVDTDAAVHAGQGAQSSVEWSIRVAASFVEDWLEQGPGFTVDHS